MIKNIQKSEFKKNVLILFSGSLISQIIPFLSLPILQKYFFSPADFGLFAVFFSLIELLSNVSCLKLEYGIVLQKKLKDAINVAYGALRISWVLAILSLLIVLLFKKQLALYLKEPSIENYLFLIPIYILFIALNDVFGYWFNRKKRFGIISTTKIVQTSAAEFIKLGGGYLGFNFVSLIVGKISGVIFSVFQFAYRFYKEDIKSIKLINKKHSNLMIKKNKNFIFFTAPSVFTSSIINFAYLNLFLYYFGKDAVGMVGVSMIYLSAGFGVISISFSQVFYSRIAETDSKSEIMQLYKRFAKNLFLLALVPTIGVYLIPNSWVAYLLGAEWNELMNIVRIMVIWLAIWFVSSSLSFIYIRLGRQKEMVLFDVIHLIVIFISFHLALFFNHSFYSALWGFSIGQALFYVFAIIIAIHYIKRFNVKT